MSVTRLPVLTEDGTRLDWKRATYKVSVVLRSDAVDITHAVEGAPELDRLLGEGAATWVTELRCPRTLFCRQEPSGRTHQKVKWGGENVSGNVYLIPGMVTSQEVDLAASGLNNLIWPKECSVALPAGWWLARGDVRSVTPLVASLLSFRPDPGLDSGQMAVVEDINDVGKPRFCVSLASDLYEHHREDRDIQIAGLIAACGLLPRSSFSESSPNYDEDLPIIAQLRQRFEHEGVSHWESDDFDPARAATALEAFYVQPDQGERA